MLQEKCILNQAALHLVNQKLFHLQISRKLYHQRTQAIWKLLVILIICDFGFKYFK